MSIDSTWELRTKSSPKAVCFYPAASGGGAAGAAENSSNNPFGDAVAANTTTTTTVGSGGGPTTHPTASVQACVFGTERGSLHYRTYPSPSSSNKKKGRSGNNTPIEPLGTSTGTTTTTTTTTSSLLPRTYLPIDLKEGGLSSSSSSSSSNSSSSSSIVSIIYASDSPSHRPIFLVLLDDNKGSTATSGMYNSCLLTIQNSSFTKLSSSSTTTTSTRITSATYHPRIGYLICTGRRLQTIPHEKFLLPADLKNFHHHNNNNTTTNRRGGVNNKLGYYNNNDNDNNKATTTSSSSGMMTMDFSNILLPPPGGRSDGGQDSLKVLFNGKVAIIAVGNTVIAVSGIPKTKLSSSTTTTTTTTPHQDYKKLISFGTSSSSGGGGGGGSGSSSGTSSSSVLQKQVHPIIILDVQDRSMDNKDWACLFVANGRECAIIDIHYDSESYQISSSPTPRHGNVVTLPSPILSAVSSWPYLVLLTLDGLCTIRSPSCLAIPLKTVEVGTVPNDYFSLQTLDNNNNNNNNNNNIQKRLPWIVCSSYSGRVKTLQCQRDTKQDLADRLMRHSIDAFGTNGFPRQELAEALAVSFTATSYVGQGFTSSGEPTVQSRQLLRQYLEAILGLTDFDGGSKPGWPTEHNNDYYNLEGGEGQQQQQGDDDEEYYNGNKGSSRRSGGDGGIMGAFDEASSFTSVTTTTNTTTNNNNSSSWSGSSSSPLARSSPVVTAETTPNALLTGTALLCLVCTQLDPIKSSLANRAAKECAAKMGVVLPNTPSLQSAALVNEIIADR